jgi:hypothetical protein
MSHVIPDIQGENNSASKLLISFQVLNIFVGFGIKSMDSLLILDLPARQAFKLLVSIYTLRILVRLSAFDHWIGFR